MARHVSPYMRYEDMKFRLDAEITEACALMAAKISTVLSIEEFEDLVELNYHNKNGNIPLDMAFMNELRRRKGET